MPFIKVDEWAQLTSRNQCYSTNIQIKLITTGCHFYQHITHAEFILPSNLRKNLIINTIEFHC